MADGHRQPCQQQVHVRRAVRTPELHGLFQLRVDLRRLLLRVGVAGHASGAGTPSQRHADQHRTVAVAPADVRRSLLVRNQPEVGGRVRIPEGRQRGGQRQIARDGFQRRVRKAAVRVDRGVVATVHQPCVDVQAAPGLPDGDLRRKGHLHAVFVGQRAEDPFGYGQLVGRRFQIRGQKFDLVLFVHHPLLREVAHFGVAVFDLAARLGDVFHGAGAEFGSLVEGGRFVVPPLVDGREELLLRTHDVEFQLAHGVEVESRGALQLLPGVAQGLFRGHVEGRALLRVVAAQDVHGRDLAERIPEGRPVARHDVQVARSGLDVGEEARTVDPFAAGEDAFQIGFVVDDEIQRLQPSVGAGVAEVEHFDGVLPDVADDVRAGERCARFSEKAHERIGGQCRLHLFIHFRSMCFDS